MRTNKIIQLLCSFPVILLILYWNHFLGICLIILRIISNKKRTKFSLYLITSGILLLIPKLLSHIFNLISFDRNTIPYFNDIVTANFYNVNCIEYSKLLLTIGILYLTIEYIMQRIRNRISSSMINYFKNQQQMEQEIFQKNYLLMQEKRERALNTHVVYCSYCGAENMLSERIGTCKYCRRKIEYKEKE